MIIARCIIGYLAVGVGGVRLVRHQLDSDDPFFLGFIVLGWPVWALCGAVMLTFHGLGKLAGGK